MRRHILFILFFSLCPLLFACNQEKSPEGQNSGAGRKNQSRIIPVTVTTIVPQRLDRAISATGTLFPEDEVSLSAEVEGRVSGVYHEEGDSVAKGDLLVEIEQTDFLLKLEESRANLKFLESEISRKEGLYKEGLISPQQYEEIKTKHALALVALNVAQERLSKTRIASPLRGFISDKSVSDGEYVRPGTPLMTVIKLDPIRLRASVSEVQANRIKIGQKVKVKVKALGEMEFAGKISLISPQINPSTRTLEFEAKISNPSRHLKPGALADVQVITESKPDVILLPEDAIVIRGSQTIAYVVANSSTPQSNQMKGVQEVPGGEDGIAISRPVIIGEWFGGKVEVLEGLAPGEKVVVRGSRYLTDRIGVKIVPAE